MLTAAQRYTIQAVKGVKTSIDNGMTGYIDLMRDNRVVDMYDTDQVFEIFTSTEGMNGFKELAERETPPVLKKEAGYSTTIRERKFGGAIEITVDQYKAWKNDSSLPFVRKFLDDERNALMDEARMTILEHMFTFLNYAFDTTYYAAPDAAALIGTHTWKTPGASTFSNKATKKFTLSALQDMERYAGAFRLPDGKPYPLKFDTIIVKTGSENEREATKLLAKNIAPVSIDDINIYQGGGKTIVSTPHIDSDKENYWFARASRLMTGNSLKMGFTSMPTMYEPIVQNDESIRTNCLGFWKQGIVNIPFDWYGSDGSN